jgi:hypothetical protein
VINRVFTFDVPVEKQAEYIKATKEIIKPWWEAHVCRSYDIWQADGENTFMKVMLYPDMATLEKGVELSKTDPECKSVVELWKSFANNITCKNYIKKT